MELTHASFFSGVGGLDLGLERAGWRTVSFSEIDPYASTVLAERWPGVPNLGDIVSLARRDGDVGDDQPRRGSDDGPDAAWTAATLWSGGFPCQDLSVAGKRAGLAGARSGLAYAFLDLVERHRPPAILLENVPGLLSSHAGRDLGALLGRLGELGYWWAYRILDAQFFGVPQRRRRVFICALHAGAGFGADSPAAVLSVGARCDGHSQAGKEAREGAAGVLADGARTARTVQSAFGHHGWTLGAQDVDGGYLQLGTPPDSGGVREADGLAGRLDDRQHPSLRAGGHGSPGIGRDGDEQRLVVGTLTAPDTRHRVEAGKRQDGSRRDRIPITLAPTLRVGPARPQDGGPGDTVPIIVNALDQRRGGVDDNEAQGGQLVTDMRVREADDVQRMAGPHADYGTRDLPLGLDSHRYRCCGNGVVAPVSEWIGWRLRWAVEGMKAAA